MQKQSRQSPTARKRSKSPNRKTKPAKQFVAKTADIYELYELAVQTPDAECDFFDRVFKKHNGKLPRILREDFCATAAICRDWVTRRESNLAIGVDLDPNPLEWARTRRINLLKEEEAARISLLKMNVLDASHSSPRADVISAGNFSWWVFQTRDLVRQYFKSVRESLAPRGMFVLDLMGGTRTMDEMEERRRCKGFTYVWEQHSFEPLTNEYICYIHFEFKRGPRIEKAFRYDWRLWSLTETLELLAEAGFKTSTVYLEGDDKRGGGNGKYSPVKKGENCESYLAYVVSHD